MREQFRIAEGGTLDYDDPVAHGHSFEFRINGEDPGLNFLPSPGPVNVLRVPGGPGVRVDSGVTTGDVICGAFDSLLAKLIVTGSSPRGCARAVPPRARRVRGRRPAHRAAVPPQDRARPGLHLVEPFSVYTRWIETDFVNDIEPWSGSLPADGTRPVQAAQRGASRSTASASRCSLPAKLMRRRPARRRSLRRRAGATSGAVSTVTGDAVNAPMQATIVKVAVAEGDKVVKGDLLLVLEAMKMEQPITAHKDGTIGALDAAVGSTVPSGHVLLAIHD